MAGEAVRLQLKFVEEPAARFDGGESKGLKAVGSEGGAILQKVGSVRANGWNQEQRGKAIH